MFCTIVCDKSLLLLVIYKLSLLPSCHWSLTYLQFLVHHL